MEIPNGCRAWGEAVSTPNSTEQMEEPDSPTPGLANLQGPEDGVLEGVSSFDMHFPQQEQDSDHPYYQAWTQFQSHPVYLVAKSPSLSYFHAWSQTSDAHMLSGYPHPGRGDGANTSHVPFSYPVYDTLEHPTGRSKMSHSSPDHFPSSSTSACADPSMPPSQPMDGPAAAVVAYTGHSWPGCIEPAGAGVITLGPTYDDWASLQSSQDGVPPSEDSQSNVWTTGTTNSAELSRSMDEMAAVPISFPLSRNPSGYSKGTTDSPGTIPYLSPDLSVARPMSPRSSIAFYDQLPQAFHQATVEDLAGSDFTMVPAHDFAGPNLCSDRNPVSPMSGCSSLQGLQELSLCGVPPVMASVDGAPLSFQAIPHPGNNLGLTGVSPRNDPLYQASPGRDGKFHCPYEGSEGCNHGPTKLKCNYDKYVDSHIKPYRCSYPSCSEQRFSSTACRLRHEREAHGLHGHGAKPYVCLFAQCERSAEGNGFPRRWNLFDHMRRVHEYVPDGSSVGPNSPVAGSNSTLGSQHNRRRKLSTSQGAKKNRVRSKARQKSASPQMASHEPVAHHDQLLQDLHSGQKALHLSWSQKVRASRSSLSQDALEAHTERLRSVVADVRQLNSDLVQDAVVED